MGFEIFLPLGVILLAITSITILISTKWLISIIALMLQSVGVTLLVLIEWPLEMAIIKLVTGWITVAVLGMALINLSKIKSKIQANSFKSDSDLTLIPLPMGRYFPLLAAALVLLTIFTVSNQVLQWLPEFRIEVLWGALILVSMGLLRLGFGTNPLATILGLLTFLSGFEILYAGMETSALLAGLLAAVNLGLALSGAYFLLSATIEETS